jgi:hypothetical protein
MTTLRDDLQASLYTPWINLLNVNTAKNGLNKSYEKYETRILCSINFFHKSYGFQDN